MHEHLKTTACRQKIGVIPWFSSTRITRRAGQARTDDEGCFSISSIVSSLLMGVALGNIVVGIPLTPEGEYLGGLSGMLRPFPLFVGLTTVALFAMHGAIYVVMKTEGELQAQVRSWIPRLIGVFVACYVITTVAVLVFIPHMTTALTEYPILLAVPLLNALAIANIPREVHRGRDFRAFPHQGVPEH